MITCTRSFGFDAGHRIVGHESKCANLHGHRYTAEVTCKAPSLDHLGRVIDFGCIKEIIGAWIDEHWDHNMILFGDDPLLNMGTFTMFGKKRPYVMQDNPTAECMAIHLWYVASNLLKKKSIEVVKVRLWETPNCYAEFDGKSDIDAVWIPGPEAPTSSNVPEHAQNPNGAPGTEPGPERDASGDVEHDTDSQ